MSGRSRSAACLLHLRAILPVLLMLSSSLAFAQDGGDAPVQPPIRDDVAGPARPSPPPPPRSLYLLQPPVTRRIPRIAVELVFGGLSQLTGAAIGAVAGCLIVPYGPQGCLPAFLYGGLIGGLLAVPIGTSLAGYLMDGDGSIYATFAGSIGGVALAAGLIASTLYSVAVNSTGAIFLAMGVLLLPNAGAILAYELTSHTSRRYFEAINGPGEVAVAPLFAPTGIRGAAISFRF